MSQTLPPVLGAGAGTLYRLSSASAPNSGSAALSFNKSQNSWGFSPLGDSASRSVGTGAGDVAAGLHGHSKIENLNGSVAIQGDGSALASSFVKATYFLTPQDSGLFISIPGYNFYDHGLLFYQYGMELRSGAGLLNINSSSGNVGIGLYSSENPISRLTVRNNHANIPAQLIEGAASQVAPLLLFQQKSNTNTSRDAVSLDAVVTDSSDASFSADVVIKSAKNGVLTEAARFRDGYMVGKGLSNVGVTFGIGPDGNTSLSTGALLVPNMAAYGGVYTSYVSLDTCDVKGGGNIRFLSPTSTYDAQLHRPSAGVIAASEVSTVDFARFAAKGYKLSGLSNTNTAHDTGGIEVEITTSSDASFAADVIVSASKNGVLLPVLRAGADVTRIMADGQGPNLVLSDRTGLRPFYLRFDNITAYQQFEVGGNVYGFEFKGADTSAAYGHRFLIGNTNVLDIKKGTVSIPTNTLLNVGGGRIYDDGAFHMDAGTSTALVFSGWNYVGLPGAALYPSAWDVGVRVTTYGGIVATSSGGVPLAARGKGEVLDTLFTFQQLSNTSTVRDAAYLQIALDDSSDANFTTKLNVCVASNGTVQKAASFSYLAGIGGNLTIPYLSADYLAVTNYIALGGSGGLVYDNGTRVLGPGGGQGPFQASEFRVNYLKVLGAQQPAIADHASDGTVNLILATLRAHGLIASI